MYNIMNNSANFQSDLASYNNEIASEFQRRDARTAAMRGQLERKKDERVANLVGEAKEYEDSAREFLEGGFSAGSLAKELITGAPNVRKLGRGLAKLGQKGFNAAQKLGQNQPFNEGEPEEPGIEMRSQQPEGDLGGESMNEPVSETGADETNIFGRTDDPRYNARAQEGKDGTQEEKTSEDVEETKQDTPDSNENAGEDIEEDATQDVEKSVTKTAEEDLGEELLGDSLLDFLGPVGWAVGISLGVGGLVEEVVNANKSHNASEQAQNLRNQVVNVKPQPVNLSGSYVAASKQTIY